MKILITYSSRTGNTKRIAEAIHEELKDQSVLLPMEDVKSLEGYDFIFVGFWADKGTADKKALEFMEGLKNQKVGLFATLGAYPYSLHAHQILVRTAAELDESNQVVGTFICQGAVDPQLLKMFESFPKDHSHYPTAKSRLRQKLAKDHPNADDEQEARRIFRWIVEREIDG